jgi:DNA-binding NtrC family response regulator
MSYDFPGMSGNCAPWFLMPQRAANTACSLEPFKETIRKEAERPRTGPVPADEIPALSIPDGRFPKLREAEEFLVQEALRRAGGNQGLAASFLGISRQALNKRVNKTK